MDKQGHAVICSDDDLRMCRSCFNDYDKVSLKIAVLNEKFKLAAVKLSKFLSQADPQLSQYNSEYSLESMESSTQNSSRKRTLEGCSPAAKRVIEPPLLLPNNSTSPSVLASMTCCINCVYILQVYS